MFCAAVLGLAIIGRLALGGLPLNPVDTGFTLGWGHELWQGHLPDVRVAGASTPHPLSIISGAVATFAGGSALDVMEDLAVLSASAIVVTLIAIGRIVRVPLAGVAAATILVASGRFLFSSLALAAPSDLPALAAVLGALALELERPRRGYAPLGLLAVAGLWRPEAWLLSLSYACYCAPALRPSTRRNLFFIALMGPGIWATSDLVLTGDPVYSLTYTQWSTAIAARPTGLGNVPSVLWSTLDAYVGVPMLIAASAGLALDLWIGIVPRIVSIWLMLTVTALGLVGAAGLPVISRYALPTVLATTLYCGVFIGGWMRAHRGWLRRGWQLAAGALLLAMFAGVASGMGHLARQRSKLDELGRLDRELGALASDARVRHFVSACPPLEASYQVAPLLAFDLGVSPRTITWADAGIPADGTVVEPGHSQQLFDARSYRPSAYLKRGYLLLAANDGWLAFTRCSGPRPREMMGALQRASESFAGHLPAADGR